jgi:outer membrane protein TolC
VEIAKKPLDLIKLKASDLSAEHKMENEAISDIVSLTGLIESSRASVDLGADFSSALRQALEIDPSLAASKRRLSAQLANVVVTEATKDFQVSGTMLAGIEDFSDKESGLALILSANRLLFDGGEIDAKIKAQNYSVESARHSLEAKTNNRAMELANIYIDLNRFTTLKGQIDDRLVVLGPLIEQLERVAAAGIGDVTRVAAAERTVAVIEATQTEVVERLKQARLEFVNGFGREADIDAFDFSFLSDALPSSVIPEDALSAPAIKAAYSSYISSMASLAAVRAKDNYTVGLESRIQKPLADSTYDSDEKIGLVIRRTIYDGKMLESEIQQVEAQVQASMHEVQQAYIEGERIILTAQQHMQAMDKALILANKTVKNMEDEIAYLKKQLIIGGSTLDSVLSAEARLYGMQANQINYVAEKQKSVVSILSSLGVITKVLGISYH